MCLLSWSQRSTQWTHSLAVVTSLAENSRLAPKITVFKLGGTALPRDTRNSTWPGFGLRILLFSNLFGVVLCRPTVNSPKMDFAVWLPTESRFWLVQDSQCFIQFRIQINPHGKNLSISLISRQRVIKNSKKFKVHPQGIYLDFHWIPRLLLVQGFVSPSALDKLSF